jgi:LCP family protein required for cell wall assembly
MPKKKKRSAQPVLETSSVESSQLHSETSASDSPSSPSITRNLNPNYHPVDIYPHVSLLGLFIKTTLLSLFFVAIFLILTALAVFAYALKKANTFSQNAEVPISQLVETAKQGWNTSPQQTDGKVNFLILGTDDLQNRAHNVVLTDTILIASLDLNSATVSLFSIPRDLWLKDYQTKINALYNYGKTKYPNEPQKFPTEAIQTITYVPIHHTIVINLDTLGELIDEAGGVDIDIKEGFVDPLFPREDVDVTKVHDPKLLYKTVEFKQGVEHMSGQRVLEYVRSRHANGDQGTDDARAQRQQQVILSLVNLFKQPSFIKDVARDGKLYHFYLAHFANYLPVTELIGIGHKMYPVRNSLKFISGGPSIFPDAPNGTITHPPTTRRDPEWKYIIRDEFDFGKEVREKLNIKDKLIID